MKLGIVGAGLIVKEFLKVAHNIPDLEIIALLSRPESLQKNHLLCETYAIQKLYTDYDVMLMDPHIETIYVAVPNHLHFDFSLKALSQGKHVICEKPFTITVTEAETLKEAALNHQCMIFEAISTLYLQNYEGIRKALTSKAIGDVKIVTCNFSKISSRYAEFKAGQIMPAFDPKMYGGALMDLNCYNLHFILGQFGMPQGINHYPNMSKGIDTSGIVVLDYDGFKCLCIAAKDSNSASSIDIQGDQGNLHVDAPSSLINTYTITDVYNHKTLYNENLHEHRMVNTFIEITKYIVHKDHDYWRTMLEHSINVVSILEEARNQVLLNQPISLKDL